MKRALLFGFCWVGFAATVAAKPPVVQLALNGLDPVALVAGREARGDVERTVVLGRFRYLFENDANRVRFAAAPQSFAIQMDGACARMGPWSGSGAPDRFLVHDGRIFIFASDQCRSTFQGAPERFVVRLDDPPRGTPAEQKRGLELIDRALAGFGGAAKVDALSSYRLEKRLTYGAGDQASTGTAILTIDFSGPVRSEQIWSDGRFADVIGRTQTFQVQGTEWWPISDDGAAQLRRTVYRSPLIALRLRKQPGFAACASGTGKVGDQAVEWVQVGLAGATSTWSVDPVSGRILQIQHRGRFGSLDETTLAFSDFRELPEHGVVLPHAIAESMNGKPITSPMQSIQSITVNGPVDEALFRTPE